MEYIKDLLSAMNSRIRSPFFGSIALVFILTNWKAIYYVIFSQQSASIRIRYFELNTDLISLLALPIGLGVLIALTAPWLKYLGALFAAAPTRSLRSLQDIEGQKREIENLKLQADYEFAKAEHEAARERRLIDSAKRDREVEQIGDENLKKDIESEREKSIEKSVEVSSRALDLLREIAGTPKGSIKAYEDEGEPKVIVGRTLKEVSDRKRFLEILEDLDLLNSYGYLSRNGVEWKMTMFGYENVDRI